MSKTDIFFSYANEDKGRVARLVVALEAGGWSVFWDRRIPAGQTWRSHIGRALEQARCVVVAWSEHSIQSEWVIEEADDGRERGILVPAFLDPVRPPRGFRAIQAADLSGWSPEHPSPAFESFLADLGAVLGAPHSEPSTISPVSEVSPVKHGLGEQDEPATTLQQGAAVEQASGDDAASRLAGGTVDTPHASKTPVPPAGQLAVVDPPAWREVEVDPAPPAGGEERPVAMEPTSGLLRPAGAKHLAPLDAAPAEQARSSAVVPKKAGGPRKPRGGRTVSPVKHGLGEQDEPATLQQGAAVEQAGGDDAASRLAGGTVDTPHASKTPVPPAGQLVAVVDPPAWREVKVDPAPPASGEQRPGGCR